MPKRKYRMLRVGEVIREGDEFFKYSWRTSVRAGGCVQKWQKGTYRRPLRRKHAPR